MEADQEETAKAPAAEKEREDQTRKYSNEEERARNPNVAPPPEGEVLALCSAFVVVAVLGWCSACCSVLSALSADGGCVGVLCRLGSCTTNAVCLHRFSFDHFFRQVASGQRSLVGPYVYMLVVYMRIPSSKPLRCRGPTYLVRQRQQHREASPEQDSPSMPVSSLRIGVEFRCVIVHVYHLRLYI